MALTKVSPHLSYLFPDGTVACRDEDWTWGLASGICDEWATDFRPMEMGSLLVELLERDLGQTLIGFQEEFLVKRGDGTYQGAGSRQVNYDPARKLGAKGRKEFQLCESLELNRGMGKKTLRASSQKPLTVVTVVSICTGRANGKRHGLALPEELVRNSV